MRSSIAQKLQIFLCHRNPDKERVRTILFEPLKDAGFSVWLDEVALSAGVEWARQIASAIREADVVLVCLSRGWGSGGYVQNEVHAALQQIKSQPQSLLVIPVLLEECEIPAELSSRHAVRLYTEGGYRQLVRDLRSYRFETNPAHAIETLAGRIAKDPSAGAYVKRAYAYGELSEFRKAEEDFTAAIRLDNQFAPAYQGRGRLYSYVSLNEKFLDRLVLGPYSCAMKDFDTAIVLRPLDASGYLDRAQCYAGHGKHKKALPDLDKALRISPKLLPAWIERGFALLALGEWAQAIQDFTEALNLEPEEAEAYFGRAQCYGAMNEPRLAIRDYNRTIKLDPNNADAFMRRSWEKTETGDEAGAERDRKKAKTLGCIL